jgi:hypothetical protein
MIQTPNYFFYHVITTAERQAWIVAARTDIELADLLLQASSAERINMKNPEFSLGLTILYNRGILTKERVDNIKGLRKA